VPSAFPAAVVAEAEASVRRGPTVPTGEPGAERLDRRDIELVTIDPLGSRDLDQAYGAERRGSGYRVHYAIADVAAFVAPGGALDGEARDRGVTLYCPDGRAPLYPDVLGEGAASLLADADRPAVLWTLDLDQRGVLTDARLERSVVRSRQALDYVSVQSAVDEGTTSPQLVLLREIGLLREEQERLRGGVSLDLPAQDVVPRTDGGYDLQYDAALPVEGWNEQISLLAGMAAADRMLDAGVGLLRTLPPAEPGVFDSLRHSARALGVPWPDDLAYPAFVRSLDPRKPADAALMTQSARVLRGAGYAAFDGAPPAQAAHAAIASTYAHVTAPLRRLADRFANEIVLAACAGRRPPPWVLDALAELPDLMNSANRHDRSLERAVVDFMEAAVLAHRVGEVFEAVVTSVGKGPTNVQLREPAVLASVDAGGLEPGSEVRLHLDSVDLAARTVTFSVSGTRP